MVIKFYKGGIIRGTNAERLALDTTDLPPYTLFIETDTADIYDWTGSVWRKRGGGGAGSGQGGYRWLVYKSGSDFIAESGIDGTIGSQDTSATTVTQFALDNLTVGRTWKETVKLKGDFTVTKIRPSSFTILDLIEARLFQANATNTQLIENSDVTNGNNNIEIVGGVIDGNKANQSAGGVTEEERSMIVFWKCSDIIVTRATLKNGNFHNIRFTKCPGPVIFTNNISLDARNEHVSDHAIGEPVNLCRNHIIANNYFENVVAGQSFIATVNIADCIIANNTCQKTFDNTSGIAPNGLRSIVIGNTLRNVDGPGIVTSQMAGTDFDTSDSIIADNIVTDTAGHGIVLADGQAGRNVDISNNVVNGTTETTFSGIVVSAGWQDVVVEGNIVHDCGGGGINTGSNSGKNTKNINIVNNICYNNGKGLGVDTVRSGISLNCTALGEITNIIVENNRCYDSQATKTQKYGVRLNLTQNCIVRNNDLRGNLTRAIEITTDAGSIIERNIGDIHEPRKKKGSYSGHSGSIATGILSGNVGGPGTKTRQLSVPDKDAWTRWDTGETSGAVAGPRVTQPLLVARGLNPVFKCHFRVNDTTNDRVFIGFVSNSANLGSDDHLNIISGIGIGWRSTDSNWQILHNDGTGGTAVTQIVPTTTKDSVIRTVEIKAIDALSKFEVKFDDNPPQSITSDIPSQTTAITIIVQVMNTEPEAKTIDPFYFEVEHDRV